MPLMPVHLQRISINLDIGVKSARRVALNGHVTAISDLAAGQLFIGVPEVAAILGRDERTVRKAAEKGDIPGWKVGARWLIPVAWLREQAAVAEAAAVVTPDPDALADRVADRVVTRLAGLLARGQDAEADGEPEAMS
jgi:excisionase family DNA binding protein